MADRAGPKQATKAIIGPWHLSCGVLIALLFVLALPDLLSPPISPTILRQTQTYILTRHFGEAGFSLAGLYTDMNGPVPLHLVYEFPLYNFAVGLLFAVFGPAFFWGKLVSLIASITGLLILLHLLRTRWSESVAIRAGLFYVSCPIALLLAASFQPDAVAMVFMFGSLALLGRWQNGNGLGHWAWFCLLLLAAGLTKFPVLVPYVPLIVGAVLWRDRRWRIPRIVELALAIAIFVVPFVGWYLYRARLMTPESLVGEQSAFLIGDLSRFLHAGFYVKPGFIVGAMVCCGVGLVPAAFGLRGLEPAGRLLAAGVPLYFVVIPTAADQTYYAYPLVPIFALLLGRGLWRLEQFAPARHRGWVRGLFAAAWIAGLAVVAPYTLRHDNVTLAAATAVRRVSGPDDLLFVMNMHDRGVGIGLLNSSIVTLAERRGWNVRFEAPSVAVLLPQIEARRQAGARWLVATWYTQDLDPWFTPFLPASFSRCPRFADQPVDGHGLAEQLALHYPIVVQGLNFAVLRLE